MFLQYILKEDPDSLISKFFHTQDSKPLRNDWSLYCRKDMEEIELKLTFEEIQSMSKDRFKAIVSKAVTKISNETQAIHIFFFTLLVMLGIYEP